MTCIARLGVASELVHAKRTLRSLCNLYNRALEKYVTV
jgi:hypothetical protein